MVSLAYYYMESPDRYGCWITQKRIMELYDLRLRLSNLMLENHNLSKRIEYFSQKLKGIIDRRESFVLANKHIKYSNYYN